MIFWPALLAGLVLLAVGILLIRKRSEVAEANAKLQRSTFGRGGESTAQRSTPGQMRLVGIFALILGSALVIASFLNLNW